MAKPVSGMPERLELNLQVHAMAKGNWPTPTTRDWKDGTAKSCENVPVNGLLGRFVHTVTDDRPKSKGSLNPAWVNQLMGYPDGWLDLPAETLSKLSATQSSPKSSK